MQEDKGTLSGFYKIPQVLINNIYLQAGMVLSNVNPNVWKLLNTVI